MPKKPETAIHFHLFLSIFLINLNPIINIIIDEKTILSEPNCNGENPIRPFLIKMNELPQIMDRANKYPHLLLILLIIYWIPL